MLEMLWTLLENLVVRVDQWWRRPSPLGQVAPGWLRDRCRDAEW